MTLLDRRLIFVTGKGGVGKTTIAAALADLAAARGRRTLLCEMDAKGAVAQAFDAAPLSFTPAEVRPGLHAMAMNTEDSLREYLRVAVRLPLVGRIGPLARTFDFVADAAPGVKEILAIGKLCYEVREDHYDLVVVDAEASGHVIAQLDAPRAIRDLVQVGLVHEQTTWMLDILADQARTGLVAVTTPEEMPVAETVDLLRRVREETTVDVAAVVANRVLPALFSAREEEVFAALDAPLPAAALADAAGEDVPIVMAAARLAHDRWRNGSGHLAGLRRSLPGGVAMLIVPELFTKATGRRVVAQVAESLAEELA